MNRTTSAYTASAHTAEYPVQVLDKMRDTAANQGWILQDSHINDKYVSITARFPDDQTAVEGFTNVFEALPDSKHMFVTTGLGVHKRDVAVLAR